MTTRSPTPMETDLRARGITPAGSKRGPTSFLEPHMGEIISLADQGFNPAQIASALKSTYRIDALPNTIAKTISRQRARMKP